MLVGSKELFRKLSSMPTRLARCEQVLTVDLEIQELLARAETLLYASRPAQPFTYSNDESEAALQHALLYLSMLIDCVASSIAMLAYHGLGRPSEMLSRQVVEYLAKALYFDAEPDEALFQSYYVARAQIELFHSRGETQGADYEAARLFLAEATKRYPELADLKRKKIRRPVSAYKMIRRFTDYERYATLYKYPSQFIHADLFGAYEMLPHEIDGIIQHGFTLDQENTDELLLVLAWHMAAFATVCDRRFGTDRNADIVALQDDLERVFQERVPQEPPMPPHPKRGEA